ncbi:hypothetical protein P7410_28635 [Vibrio parahaemolyticus]|nr:hypothetical protein [Vibrio parahaemolyticus]MDG3027579.1 hypothetical protein [Vibrio parahaemolyticus]HCG7772954.1 hypothetical protein [Vibrio parahaemolyticus]
MRSLGIVVTVIYIIFIGWILKDKWPSFNDLSLNEVGDFCAGVFGPITFFWVILGFVMQTKELKQSSEALKLQAEELHNSVEQQKEMVKLTKEQIERDLLHAEELRQKQRLAAQASIVYLGCSTFQNSAGEISYEFQLRNSGASVTKVKISPVNAAAYDIKPSTINVWDSGKAITSRITFSNDNVFPRHVPFELSYLDAMNQPCNQELKIIIAGLKPADLSLEKAS